MRNLKNTSHDEARATGWEIIKPLNCEVVGKAVFKKGKEAIMKSTKRFAVYSTREGVATLLGWIYHTSTEYHKGERVSVAEALVFVPLK